MKHRTLFAFLTFIFATGSLTRAETFSVPGAVQYALSHNRDLGIAELEIDRAKSRLRWSGRLDNPELELSASNDKIGLNEDEAVYEIAFAQKFPITSRLRDEKELRRVEVLLAETEIAEHRRQIAHEVERLAAEVIAGREKLELQERLVDLNDEIVRFLDERAGMGEVSPLEVTQARLTGKGLTREAASIRKNLEQFRLALKKQLGLQPDAPLRLTGNLSLPASAPPGELPAEPVLRKRPDYMAALVESDRARAELALQRARRFEDVSLRLFLERKNAVDEPSGLERNTFAGIGITIPLPLRKRNEEGIEGAQIDIEEARRTVEAKEFEIRNEVTAALKERLAAWRLASEASGELLQLAEKNLAEFRDAYGNGQASLLQVQRAQEQVLELKTAALELRRAYRMAEAELNFATADYANLIPPKGGASK